MDSAVLPKHVAIIMDGNGRWAKKKLLPRISGHKVAINAVKGVIELCVAKKIQYLSLFAFSTENWARPLIEINGLMNLFLSSMQKERQMLQENNIKFKVIGDRSKLNAKLQQEIDALETSTENNDGLTLNLAISYGGKWDITQACKSIAQDVIDRKLKLEDISEEKIAEKLNLADQVEPDLLIRTSGETRISNFFLWQLAYTEIYFTDVLWPDFTKEDLLDALKYFAGKQRRFGKIKETEC